MVIAGGPFPAIELGHSRVSNTGDSSGHVWPLYTRTDARGQTLTYTYDGLNRLVGKSGAYVAATYGYDAGTNGNEKRTSMTDNVGTVTYAYDNRGRLSSLARTVSGTPPYSLSFTYDDQDRVLSLTYPNGDVLTYVYGDHGKPIHAILNGTTYLVKGATYNALGRVTRLPLGNGLQTTWQYWGIDHNPQSAQNYGLPYQVQTGSVQTQQLTAYDPVGNLTALSYQDHTAENLTFVYNALNALSSANGFVSNPTSESLSYAQPDIANIGNKDGLGATATRPPRSTRPPWLAPKATPTTTTATAAPIPRDWPSTMTARIISSRSPAAPPPSSRMSTTAMASGSCASIKAAKPPISSGTGTRTM